MRVATGNPKFRELVEQLAGDLRGLADVLIRLPPASREGLEQLMSSLFDVGEDLSMLQSELTKTLIINHGDNPGLFRDYSDRRGLALWMVIGALQTAGDAHADLALALEQLLPRRYWLAMMAGLDRDGPDILDQ